MKIYQKIDRISESLPSPVLFWAKAARSCFSKWSSCSWQHGIAIQLANSWWSLNIIDTYRYYIYIYDICDIINIHEPWGYYWYMHIYILISCKYDEFWNNFNWRIRQGWSILKPPGISVQCLVVLDGGRIKVLADADIPQQLPLQQRNLSSLGLSLRPPKEWHLCAMVGFLHSKQCQTVS